MPVADTSWLVALHATADRNHEAAKADAEAASELLVPDVILGEFLNTMFTLAGGRKNPERAAAEVRAVLTGLEANPAFRFVTDPAPERSRVLFRETASLSYPDAVALHVAATSREPLLTFDAAQRRAHERLLGDAAKR